MREKEDLENGTGGSVGGIHIPPGRRAAYDRDWTQGGIINNIWLLAWPMMISSFVGILGPTVDMIWVGKLGAASIAGVGISGIAVMVVNSAKQGITQGMRAMIARFVGGGDLKGANHVAQQCFVVSTSFGILLAIIGIFMAETILRLFGVEADVVHEGAAYMRVMFVGSIFMSLRMMCEGIMQASGDSQTPMRIVIFVRLLHTALCPFLIFGWSIFPRLGVSGAALTAVVADSLGVAVALWILFSGRTRLQPTMRGFRFNGNTIWRMVRIGIPASVTGMESSFANLVMMKFIAPFGTFAVAAHSLVARIDGFIQMPAMGLGQAAGVLAGQNLGAGKPARAERTGWIATGLYSGVMLVGSLVVWFWAENVVRLFNAEPSLVEIGATFLRIQIVSYMLFGFVMVLSSCLNGVGDTMVPMISVLVGMWGVQVPLAYFLPRITNLGVYGVRWGIVIAVVMRTVIYGTYFKAGRWKRKRV
jgi:putative MATE family efflux protein